MIGQPNTLKALLAGCLGLIVAVVVGALCLLFATCALIVVVGSILAILMILWGLLGFWSILVVAVLALGLWRLNDWV